MDSPPRGCLREHLNEVSTHLPELDLLHNYLKEAAIDNPTLLGQRALQLSKKAETIVQHVVIACCKTRKRAKQNNLLNSVKSYLIELVDFIEGETLLLSWKTFHSMFYRKHIKLNSCACT